MFHHFLITVMCFVLLIPSPHSEQLGFQFEEGPHSPSAIWQSASHHCSHLIFFHLKALQLLCASWQNNCIWVFDQMSLLFVSRTGQWPGLGTGQGISKHMNRIILPGRAESVMSDSSIEQQFLYFPIVNPVLVSHLSFSFVVYSSGMEPNFHYVKVHAQ